MLARQPLLVRLRDVLSSEAIDLRSVEVNRMPCRHGSRSRWRRMTGADWAAWHDQKRRQVSARFCGIDEDVKQVFLRLSDEQLQKVFSEYGRLYGPSACRYAQRTYQRWKTGDVGMSGSTLERMLTIVPPALTFEVKVDLYRRIRERCRSRESVAVTVADSADLGVVERAAQRISERSKNQILPPLVEARLEWLSQGDWQLAKALVSRLEEDEAAVIARAVRSEIERLHNLLSYSGVVDHAQHTIQLPCGTITVQFTRKKLWRWFVSGEQGEHGAQLPVRRDSNLPAGPVKGILERAPAQLGPELSPEVIQAAQQEALRLEVKIREGQIDSAAAERELKQFLEGVEDASHIGGMAFEAEADFQRATGKTRVRVKKTQRPWWWPFG